MPKQNKKKKKKKTEREHLSWCRIEPQRNRLAPTIQDRSGKCLTEKKKTRNSQQMDRILLRTVQP